MTPTKFMCSMALALSTLVFFAIPMSYAADNPLNPMYTDAQHKKYFMMFMYMDKNSDGMLSMEEFLNRGNPLHPGYEHDPKYAKRLKIWKEMDPNGHGTISMQEFAAYMDSHNPLNPSYQHK